MDLSGYFYARFLEGIFDPNSGAEAQGGSFNGFEVTWEGFVRNVLFREHSSAESSLHMETIQGERKHSLVMPGLPQALVGDLDSGFVWADSEDLDSGAFFQDFGHGGIELVRAEPTREFPGYFLARSESDEENRWPRFIERLHVRSVGDRHLLCFTTVQGEQVGLPVTEARPEFLADDEDTGWSGWVQATDEPPSFFHQWRFLITDGGVVTLEVFESQWDEVWGSDWEKLFGYGDAALTSAAVRWVLTDIELRAKGFPLSAESVRLEALLAPARHTHSQVRCVGLFLVGIGSHKRTLLATRAKDHWSSDYSLEILNACLEAGVNDPYEIEGLVRLPIDPARARAFVQVFDLDRYHLDDSEIDWRQWDGRVDGMTSDVVEMFRDPSDQIVAADSLPISIIALSRTALGISAGASGPAVEASKVIDGVLNSGLMAKLDNFISSLSLLIEQCGERIRHRSQSPQLANDWKELEDVLRGHLFAMEDYGEELSNITVSSASHQLSHDDGATFIFKFASSEVVLEVELDDIPRPSSPSSVDQFLAGELEDQENGADSDYWKICNHYEVLEPLPLQQLGFREDLPWRFIRDHVFPLSPELTARLTIEVLWKAAEFSPKSLLMSISSEFGAERTIWKGSEISLAQELKKLRVTRPDGSKWHRLEKAVKSNFAEDPSGEAGVYVVVHEGGWADAKTTYSFFFRPDSVELEIHVNYVWEWEPPHVSSDEYAMYQAEILHFDRLIERKTNAPVIKSLRFRDTTDTEAEEVIRSFQLQLAQNISPTVKGELVLAILGGFVDETNEIDVFFGDVTGFDQVGIRSVWPIK